jgi:hypothetical protein
MRALYTYIKKRKKKLSDNTDSDFLLIRFFIIYVMILRLGSFDRNGLSHLLYSYNRIIFLPKRMRKHIRSDIIELLLKSRACSLTNVDVF